MQISFPPNLLGIEKWKAFKGKYPPGSNVEHRIIIVYKHDGNLKYFYVTSKVETARNLAMHDKGSLVDKIDGSDWDALDKESCIQCDKKHLRNTSEDELRKAYKEGGIKVLGEIPEKIKKLIISAVCASITFSDIEKTLYTV